MPVRVEERRGVNELQLSAQMRGLSLRTGLGRLVSKYEGWDGTEETAAMGLVYPHNPTPLCGLEGLLVNFSNQPPLSTLSRLST